MIEDTDPTRLSGVRVATSTRGFDVSVHAYVGCSQQQLEAAGDLAVNEYVRVTLALKDLFNQQGIDAFAAEVARRSSPRGA